MEKNWGTPASPATAARAASCRFRVGRRADALGIFAPTARNLAGSWRNSLISWSSSTASSQPATS